MVLLEAGADLNARTEDYSAPLHRAASFGTAETVTALLAAGADANARTEDGTTPLHHAAIEGNPDTLEVLLEAGTDLEARTDDGQTPLHHAARGVGSRIGTVVTALLEVGARSECTGR